LKKTVGYLRVSQDDETVENQRLKIQEFAEKRDMQLVGFFADVDVSGTVPPRERPQYRAMLEFCQLNNIKTIIFYDLSRLARSVEEGLLELQRLADEGYNFYFAGMDFLNYDIDPMLKKKMIIDFLWFAELYVEDVKRRTKIAMERLRNEGRVYHRPALIHYVAMYLAGKKRPGELVQEDIEKAKEHIRRFIEPLERLGVPRYRIYKRFLEHYSDLYRAFPKAPRSYQAFRDLLKQLQ